MSSERRNRTFFGNQEPHSAIKSGIVADYFAAWAKTPIQADIRRLYLDLFAGPGLYADGAESTPLLILRKIIENDRLHDRVITIFGDEDNGNIQRLTSAIQALPGIERLKYQPIAKAGTVTDDFQRQLSELRLVPTLMFIDPFGYKAINASTIHAIIKNPGSECLFFFNYNRVMPAISNPSVHHLVSSIFGVERVAELREALPSLDNDGKEQMLIASLRSSMKEIGGGFTLPFRFRRNGRTTHHLVFVGTHQLGHKIMKEIMGNRSSDSFQGVPSFEFRQGTVPMDLFESEPRPIDALKQDLLTVFAGKAKTVQAIFDEHNLGTPYVLKNYKEALKELMRDKLIPEGTRTLLNRRALAFPYPTMPDDVLIQFPGGR